MGGGKSKMLKLLVLSTLFYMLTNYILFHSVVTEESSFPWWKNLATIVLFNVNPFAYHLWYLSAYIYVLLFIYGIKRYNLWRLAYLTVPILLIVGIVYGKYSNLLFQREFYNFFTRNFLFVGLPFYLIGHFIARHKKRFLLHKGRLIYVLSTLLFTILAIVEGLWVNKIFGDIYICTAFLSVSIFLLTLSCRVEREGVISRIGRKDTLYIYITHLFWIKAMSLLMTNASERWLELYRMTGPLVILIISLSTIKLVEFIRFTYTFYQK